MVFKRKIPAVYVGTHPAVDQMLSVRDLHFARLRNGKIQIKITSLFPSKVHDDIHPRLLRSHPHRLGKGTNCCVPAEHLFGRNKRECGPQHALARRALFPFRKVALLHDLPVHGRRKTKPADGPGIKFLGKIFHVRRLKTLRPISRKLQLSAFSAS